jgi:Fe-S cluster assembly protein SufD
MTLVAERLDFGAASAASGTADSPETAKLRAQAAALAGKLEWPDSHEQRPWKYYDATTIGITPSTPLAKIALAASGAAVVTNGAPPSLGAVVKPETDRLTALHYAFRGETAFVNVAANAELAEPVRLAWTITGPGLAAPHTSIVTGANARLTVIEEFVSGDEDVVVLPATEIVPGPGSEVRHYVVHRWGANTRVFLNQRFYGKERDSALQSLHMVLAGAVVKGHLESTMEARGSSSELLGIAFGTDHCQADFYTLQDHVGPDTRSDLKYKSALKDESRAVYYGLTRVGLGARNADANQENRNLLLSKLARADSDPVLEILTSDIIRASHGATAGPVDQEQLFYMQARGIPRPEAESLLVTAFLEDVLSRIKDAAIREELIQKLEERLEA